eukprot:TRINITY_DN3698_c0_g1_i1.p1 TRINITY_DN3698_c0_g1~~TRINITY_DN3698_c0_g1_i1.p1  ORF type:complete len:214 (-),score=34.14 TRINITY_DN3698_c0_g1_i1:375-1016(-)
MSATVRFPASSCSPFLASVPVQRVRTVQSSREDGLKTTPGLRPLRPKNTISLAGSTTTRVSIPAAPELRATIGWGCCQESAKRPRIGDSVGPAIEARETLPECVVLAEKCLQLQADVHQRSSELEALQKQTIILWRDYAKCWQEKIVLEEKVEEARSMIKEEPVCVICLTEHASHVMVPCGHLALCEDCCLQPIHSCPVCRQSCQRKLRVFRP